jgi:acetylornithine deacetylase/succinyl-diaminopimelate desuccinylase-like protein
VAPERAAIHDVEPQRVALLGGALEQRLIEVSNMSDGIQRLMAMVEDATDELVALHQALVRIPTVNTGAPDSGNEIEACRLLESRFKAEGIPSLILESAPSRGNLLASIGEQRRPRLLLMSHTDVVPVDESRWSVPPFGAEIREAKVYGRGSEDCKSLVSTGAMAVILLKRAGLRLSGQLSLLAAADEEAGGRYGVGWLADNHPDKICADWALNEGGGMPLDTTEGLAYLLNIGEKGRMEARFVVTGRSAHGAIPWPADNALYKLAQVLQRIQAYEPERDVSLPVFRSLSLFGVPGPVAPETIDRLLDSLARREPALALQLTGLSRLSIAPTLASGGVKSNMIPALARLTCDVRTLPHQDEGYVRRVFETLVAGIEGVELELDVTAVANTSPSTTPFVDCLQRATALALGREEPRLIPALTIGFTDSRYVRPLGTQAYGFSPLLPGSDRLRPGIHGVDEAIEIDNLVFQTRLQVAIAFLTLCDNGVRPWTT